MGALDRDRLILKSQANEILGLIQEHRLSPEEFIWGHAESVNDPRIDVSTLVYKPASYYFQFDFNGPEHFCVFSPGATTKVQAEFPRTWPNLIGILRGWLGFLRREIEAPDLWAVIKDQPVLSEVSFDQTQNTNFNAEEIVRIQNSLIEIKQYLLSAENFSPEQRQYLDEKFQHLVLQRKVGWMGYDFLTG